MSARHKYIVERNQSRFFGDFFRRNPSGILPVARIKSRQMLIELFGSIRIFCFVDIVKRPL